MKAPVLILALAALAASCSKESSAPDASIQFERVIGTFSYTLEGSADDFGRDSDVLCYDSASMVFPTHILGRDIKELQDSILIAAFDTVAAPADAMQAYFRSQATEMGYPVVPDTVMPGEEVIASGLLLVDAKAAYLSAEWLTYCVTTSLSLPGAAHGITNNRYFNYAITPGRLISLETIFTPEGLKALPDMIAAQAKRMQSVLGPTNIDALPSNGNFLIAPDGTILFAYQPYEVASYAQGEIRVPFYPYQLSDYLTPEGLTLFHLG